MTPLVVKTLNENRAIDTYLGGRIFSGYASLGTKTPYLVWQGIGSNPENTLDCGAQAEHDVYQFVVWHTNEVEATEIRLLASKALEEIGLYYTGKHPDNRDLQTKLHGRGWDMNWWSGR